MIVSVTRIGPEDRGRRMSLDEFAHAEGRPGYLYELARGEVRVVETPGLPHGLIVQAVHRRIHSYQDRRPGRIFYTATGSGCALRLPGMQSERHPDVAVYLTAPADPVNPWDAWIPDIVVEVVSAGNEAHERDYRDKREDYLAAGVREYWIVDPVTRSLLVLRRTGDRWREIRPDATAGYSTGLLPEFELDVAGLFVAP